MDAFDKSFDVLMRSEGGFSNRSAADDPGLTTIYGITEKVARAWGYNGDMRNLPLDTAKAIAKMWYWDRYQCDQFDPLIAHQVFDAAYNGGYPVKWLQECVGATPDGNIGPQTITAVRDADVWKTIALFNAKRLMYLTGLSNWPQNARGWSRRIAQNILNGA